MNANEPAYPALDHWYNVKTNKHEAVGAVGLTKRELFAAMAMQGLIHWQLAYKAKELAMKATECADALLSELERTKDASKD